MNCLRSINHPWWRTVLPVGLVCLFLCLGLAVTPKLNAQDDKIRFDVFVGFDGYLHEGEWFPVVCEVENKGPEFTATFELSPAQSRASQRRRYKVELPTASLKRFVVPAFSTGGGYVGWDARLIDEKGNVRAKREGIRSTVVAWHAPLIGALPGKFSAMPTVPDISASQEEFQPRVARLQAELFPDMPIALEGLDTIYLNSEKALRLRAEQVNGLTTWLRCGGHLILAIEQPSDITATPWLRGLIPCQVGNLIEVKADQALHRFAESGGPADSSPTSSGGGFNLPPHLYEVTPNPEPFELEPDPAFQGKTLVVTEATPSGGEVTIESNGVPLAVEAAKGKGRITVLTFSPEREPILSWKHRPWLWSSLAAIPADWYGAERFRYYGGHSVDGVFGSMIESRQIRKLPVVWLLVLLAIYLLVIGPVDHFSLKRLNRQMLTWITFPLYVVFFSALIYYIGYKLRAGENEWNELHVVDVVPSGAGKQSMLRGWTFASVYSPANAKYPVASDLREATLRPEYQGTSGAAQESSRATVLQGARGFQADLAVPVWTSQLFVSDWQKSSTNVLEGTLVRRDDRLELTLRNRLDARIESLWLAFEGKLYDLDSLHANAVRNYPISVGRAMRDLDEIVDSYRSRFGRALRGRGQALRTGSQRRLERKPLNAIAASVISLSGSPRTRNLRGRGRENLFMAPNSFDVSPLIARGQAVVFAWVEEFSPIEPLRRFNPKRERSDTLFRLTLPVGGPEQTVAGSEKIIDSETSTSFAYE